MRSEIGSEGQWGLSIVANCVYFGVLYQHFPFAVVPMPSTMMHVSPAIRPWLDTVSQRVGTAGVSNVGSVQTAYVSSLRSWVNKSRFWWFYACRYTPLPIHIPEYTHRDGVGHSELILHVSHWLARWFGVECRCVLVLFISGKGCSILFQFTQVTAAHRLRQRGCCPRPFFSHNPFTVIFSRFFFTNKIPSIKFASVKY